MHSMNVIEISKNVADLYRAFDFLPYRTYIYNRLLRPDISPEKWKLIFEPEQVERFESRLQQQLSKHFREKLHKSQVALFKSANYQEHLEVIEFLSDLYIHIRLTYDAPPPPITDQRMRELEASYLDARSCA